MGIDQRNAAVASDASTAAPPARHGRRPHEAKGEGPHSWGSTSAMRPWPPTPALPRPPRSIGGGRMNPSAFDWAALAEFTVVGLLSGGLLSMIALGFVLIYKGSGVINFAMGEFMLLGAYFFYTANVMWGLPLAAALVLAFAAVALMAAIIERG